MSPSPYADSTAWEYVRAHAADARQRRPDSLAWRGEASAALAVVWIEGELGCTPEGLVALADTVEGPVLDRLLEALGSDDAVMRRRALSGVHDRLGVRLGLEELGCGEEMGAGSAEELGCAGTPTPALPLREQCGWSVGDLRAQGEGAVGRGQSAGGSRQDSMLDAQRLALSHTPLGQPVLCGADGRRCDDLHVSFSHDGAAHVCVVARGARLRGVGVDIVHLPRLRGRADEYLYRFASHFMSKEEYDGFRRAAEGETGEALLRRVAGHFSLMEAASKALGTGLKIGAGMGKPESLPKQSVGVKVVGSLGRWVDGSVGLEFLLGVEARARCAELQAGKLEGHWATDEEYGVSAVLLHGNQTEHL